MSRNTGIVLWGYAKTLEMEPSSDGVVVFKPSRDVLSLRFSNVFFLLKTKQEERMENEWAGTKDDESNYVNWVYGHRLNGRRQMLRGERYPGQCRLAT